jgi:hypothetical protein
MLAVLGFNLINAPIEPCHPLDLERGAKQIQLPVLALIQVQEHHAGGAVLLVRIEDAVKRRLDERQHLMGKSGGPREANLKPTIPKVLLAKEDDDAGGG